MPLDGRCSQLLELSVDREAGQKCLLDLRVGYLLQVETHLKYYFKGYKTNPTSTMNYICFFA
ncbi:unnamed protein product [Rodentolepis nana]|uniref:Uncharacterized protein n=1 Tax=Rodentolepis nana TaxID=102285 RepID=A0A0R3T8Z9_RODNA|nr:unnamed protein product [Rodentolepis nana]